MNAKEATAKAIANVEELYEKVVDCRLEELSKDERLWKITISFLVEEIPESGNRLDKFRKSLVDQQEYTMVRLYKSFSISDETGELIEMSSVKA
ncbi:hypothetical protein VU10_01325 [Desulfobulbus sp. US1]|uniref:Uncharacterized protein n=1 Tax=Candidatus Electrothrix marina TaxID=1859130 RepID=A0A3S3QUZ0_9BACT|nr:hypothetical protein [Desulfobulbus sp. US4]MCW5208855.1 hypothetical protein [Desulfobulbus sp. US1]RWX48455.1 hypothetical protein VT99_10934 [Candidatus Electrothrix marina]